MRMLAQFVSVVEFSGPSPSRYDAGVAANLDVYAFALTTDETARSTRSTPADAAAPNTRSTTPESVDLKIPA